MLWYARDLTMQPSSSGYRPTFVLSLSPKFLLTLIALVLRFDHCIETKDLLSDSWTFPNVVLQQSFVIARYQQCFRSTCTLYRRSLTKPITLPVLLLRTPQHLLDFLYFFHGLSVILRIGFHLMSCVTVAKSIRHRTFFGCFCIIIATFISFNCIVPSSFSLFNFIVEFISLTNFFGRVSFVRLENPLCLPILSATVPGPHDVVGGEDNCQCCGWWDGARGALHVPWAMPCVRPPHLLSRAVASTDVSSSLHIAILLASLLAHARSLSHKHCA